MNACIPQHIHKKGRKIDFPYFLGPPTYYWNSVASKVRTNEYAFEQYERAS